MREKSQSGLVSAVGVLVPLALFALVVVLAGPVFLQGFIDEGFSAVFLSGVGTGLIFIGAAAFLVSFFVGGAVRAWNRGLAYVLAGVGAVLWFIAMFV